MDLYLPLKIPMLLESSFHKFSRQQGQGVEVGVEEGRGLRNKMAKEPELQYKTLVFPLQPSQKSFSLGPLGLSQELRYLSPSPPKFCKL